MTRPTQEAIETFKSITGASESVALQKLEEYEGNLNEAVNAYFNPGDRDITNPTAVAPPQHNNAEMNNYTQARPSTLSQLFFIARSFKPSSLLDPNYRRNLMNELGVSAVTPFVSHTGGAMGVPAAFSGRNEQVHHPGVSSVYDEITPSSQGNVLRDDSLRSFDNNMEEEMIEAAIEASKREDSSGSGLMQRQLDLLEDDEFSRAISLSLKTAEQEKEMREQRVENCDQQMEVYESGTEAEKTRKSTRELGNSSVQGAEVMHPRSPASYKLKYDLDVHPQGNKDTFPSSEWGGISPKELQEAVMLEAALFNEIPEGTSDHPQYESHSQRGLDRNAGPNYASDCHQLSSSAAAQQLLREQQDNEYLASLLADREREMNALKEAEVQLNRDEPWKESLEKEKFERWLAAKETSLPQEPAKEDGNAVTLLVKMPDGTRRGRRFVKSDKLQVLFDFIDVGRAVKPGTYRMVRSYPRRSFSVKDGSSSLNELGLTNKQELLFLEFI
ncbi:plant UBX domain-containing protein 8-like [Melia azedarach]|uniref:Plant UBX domain-containing protein 8-like n=1 Tax=Melia azedarach TaxID=155640 RepID=A0ACC1YVF3_MELAZ|nr:plant UBX domain-containing protein 8-like [Melia azedarach]